jgi:hypothetical protein
MKKTDKVSNASVKIMRSYDYCHFEITLGVDEPITIAQVDEMRKEANRLADKAVLQYKIAKRNEEIRDDGKRHAARLRERVDEIEEIPESEWTPEQKATIKAYADARWQASRYYDYEDDWDDD